MSLSVGTKLGPYEIQALLGAGGMGEVYRATDRRLDRTVAIKVLPSHLSFDPDRIQRFEREARTISSLNHPHICTLYDVGTQNSVTFLVMEFLQGETLADRLRRGALPIKEALQIGQEIADALSNAHHLGIVHRDLKPGNIMLTTSGAKLMDFGLAKPAAPALGTAASAGGPVTPATPTLSLRSLASPGSPLTQKGHVLGTFQYMSPEQLQGREADTRSDIFAFGAVLYEMTTGRRAFEGKSPLSVITAILEKEPEPVSSSRKASPPALDHVITTCLAKNPDERWQCAADVARELAWIVQVPDHAPAAQGRSQILKGTLFAAVIALAVLLGVWRPWQPSTPPGKIEFSILPPEKMAFDYGLAVSPDGQQVAFVVSPFLGASALAVRRLNSSESKLLPGTESAHFPFWSPDSNQLGFFASGKLKRIDLRNGVVQSAADTAEGTAASGEGRGGDWNANGDIIFAPSPTSALYRVPANGGNPIPLTVLDTAKGETSHRWPHFLPDGHHFTFLARIGIARETDVIFIGALDSHERQELFTASSGVQFAPPGYLVFVRGRTLFTQAFSSRKLRPIGEPFAVLDGIEPEGEAGPTYYAPFSTNAGVLAYTKSSGLQLQLAWYDRTGRKLEDVSHPGSYDEPALSPDGRRIALDIIGHRNSVWMLDLARGALSRFSFEDRAVCPIWSPDGTQIAYRTVDADLRDFSIVVRSSTGAGNAVTLFRLSQKQGGETLYPDSWSPDGRMLLVEKVDVGSRDHGSLWLLPVVGDGNELQPFLSSTFNVAHGTFSPDGRWVAYSSDETGRPEVYVQDLARTRKIQISTAGGDQALWSHNGRELFYVSAEHNLMVVGIEAHGGELKASPPSVLFHTPIRSEGLDAGRINYAVSSDGSRILLNELQPANLPTPTTVVVNWTSELKK
jgi:eukaryotic-like serine/threonine-protein kinase